MAWPGGNNTLCIPALDAIATSLLGAADLINGGAMADVLARLYHLTDNKAYRDRLVKLLAALTPTELEKALHQLSMLIGFETLDGGMQIFIASEAAATTYVCAGATGTLPLTEPNNLEDRLIGL